MALISSTLKSALCTQVGRLVRASSTLSGRVVLTDDESTYVAWHPKQDFPYECTKPLPKASVENDGTVLRSNLDAQLRTLFKANPDQARLQLMNLTHTTKHRWYPRARDRKAKKTPMDREYL